MLHAWRNYKLYAWGKNELRPLSKRPHVGCFGPYDFGATIVDGLDTLYIMGLTKEYLEGRNWIARRFSFKNIVTKIQNQKKNRELSEFSIFRQQICQYLKRLFDSWEDFCRCMH